LDSAATILAGMGKDDIANEVAVVSPAASILEMVERSSGFASPIGSLRSRSPSPVGSKLPAAPPRAEVLLTIPVSPQAASIVPSPASILGLQNIGSPPFPTQLPTISHPPARVQRPFVQTVAAAHQNATDSNLTDTSTSSRYPTLDSVTNSTSSSRQSSLKTTTLEHFPPFILNAQLSPQSPHMVSPSSLSSHPPSPVHLPKKRLSFMSYKDLLSSTHHNPTLIVSDNLCFGR
jgi:hypothetical protein